MDDDFDLSVSLEDLVNLILRSQVMCQQILEFGPELHDDPEFLEDVRDLLEDTLEIAEHVDPVRH